MRYTNDAPEKLENLTLEQLRQRVKIKKYLANRIQEKCQSAGFDITRDSVYYTFRNPNNYNAEVIKRAIIAIIKEQEERLNAFV